MTKNNNESLTGQTITKSIIFALLVIPSAISIFIAIEFKNFQVQDNIQDNYELICFTAESCALHIGNVWYKVNGIIDMEKIIPDEYKLDGSDIILPIPPSN